MTKDVGCGGNLFGGNMLAWIDEAAAIYAMEYTGEPRMVTRKFCDMFFDCPVKVGEVIRFIAEPVKEGITSFSFRIKANVNNNNVFSVECVFVCVDENGNKKIIYKFKKE